MRLIFASLLTISLISCNKDTNSYKLEGDAVGFADGTEIFVYTLENKQPKVIDTLKVTEGKFSATYPKSDAVNLNFLRINEVNGSIIFFPENEDMVATIYKDSIQASRIVGGKHLPDGDFENYSVKDGVIVVKKGAIIPSGTVIS